MEDNKKGGWNRRPEGRREYGSRPSRNNNSNGERRFSSRPGRSYGENRDGESGGRKSYGERNFYGDRPSYGERKSYGERRSFGDRKPYGERKSYGERKTYGERDSFGERKSYGERKSFSERDSYGERKSYGERRGFEQGRGGRGPAKNSGYGHSESRGSYTSSDGKKYTLRPRKGTAAPKQRKNLEDSGINRMLSRKPQLNDIELSDNDMVGIPVKEVVRLNKFIANSGVCSRREADNLILAGVVTVNGEVVTELGTKINITTDDVRFNGERLKGEEKVYIVMNKPKGFVTTASDPHADKTVMDLLKKCDARVFPVGRLDKNTTGVLMFTNDGEMAEKLTHPSYNKKKIYQVNLDKALTQEDFDQIVSGITLNDGEISADELEYIDDKDHRKIGIEIHSGKNRIVRRIFESLGYEVKALDRVYFAGLTKKNLKRGQWRFLTEGEVNVLKMGAYN